MSPFIHHGVINLVACFPNKRNPSVFMNAEMREDRTLDSYMFEVSKFTTLTPLSLLISCKLSFSDCWFENVSS